MVIKRCVLFTILIIAFCRCNTDKNKTEQKSAPEIAASDTITADSAKINIELFYRFKDNDFAKELQGLFSEYFSLIVNKGGVRKLFDAESSNFMRYPGVSQNLSIFYNRRFFKIHKPMIIAIYTQNNDTIVKLNYTRVDSTGVATSLATNNFGVTKSGGSLMLQNMVYLNSRNLEIKQVGNITYYYPRTHQFSLEEAKKMQLFNLKLAKLFDTTTLYFRYFITASNIELNRLLGYDFKYDMFNMDNSSGLSAPINEIIYSGNGSGYYPHELVHLYIGEWKGVTDNHAWFNEGLATYLGGSRGKPLEWHLKNLANYLDENGSPNLSNPFELPRQITNSTATIYAIGGLLCKLAFEKGGMEAVKQLFMTGETNEGFYKGIEEVFGVKKVGLNDFLYGHLDEYRVSS